MISDFNLLYGNDNKINTAAEAAVFTFSSRADVEAVTITELTNPECSYLVGGSCEVISTYSAEALNFTSFEWSVDGGAVLAIDPLDSSKVSVSTIAGTLTTQFNLTCTARGRTPATTESTVMYTHTRVEIPQVIINGVIENVAGSCTFDTGGTCDSESSYTVDATNEDTYLWEITGDAVIFGDPTLASCIVRSSSNNTVNFVLKITVSNSSSSASSESSYVHTRSERGPIDITSFEEVSAGCCTHA